MHNYILEHPNPPILSTYMERECYIQHVTFEDKIVLFLLRKILRGMNSQNQELHLIYHRLCFSVLCNDEMIDGATVTEATT